MSIISYRLKSVRELKNVTQIQVYNDIGVHNKTLSGYERNVSEPDIETLRKLSPESQKDLDDYLDLLKLRDMQKKN